MKNKLTLILFSFIMFISVGFITGCGNNGPSDNVKTIEAANLTSEYVKWNGRTYYNETEKLNYFFYGASGFTVKFYGTKLDATFYATKHTSVGNRPVFGVTVDSELIPNNIIEVSASQKKVVQTESVIKLTSDTVSNTETVNGKEYNYHTVTLADNLKLDYHTVTLYKQGEATDNTTAVKSLSTDKTFVKVPVENKLKVQIMGSSGITGFGDLSYSAKENEGRNTSNSSGLYSMGGLAALMYDADIEYVSVSGWTLVNDGRNMDLPRIYDHVGRTENGAFKVNNEVVMYDQTIHPDVIILNIGGNDNAVTPQQTIAASKAFTNQMHDIHPNAKIIWTGRGAYGSSINSMLTDYGKDYAKYSGTIEGNGGGNLWGAGSHASIVTQLNNANIIIETMKKMLRYEPLKTFTVSII